MMKTLRTSLARAAIGVVALGLTLVAGIGNVAYAGQQADPTPGPDVSPSLDISANASTSSDPSLPTPTLLRPDSSYYAPPSMGGSDIPSNHRGPHGDGNPNR